MIFGTVANGCARKQFNAFNGKALVVFNHVRSNTGHFIRRLRSDQ